MSFTHQITRSVHASGATISKAESITGGQEINIDESIPNGSTDLQVTFALDVSALKSFFMVSDNAITVETNSASSPAQTFALTANKPVMWATGDAGANPVTVDVTALFVTNSSGAAAALQIRALQDPTP